MADLTMYGRIEDARVRRQCCRLLRDAGDLESEDHTEHPYTPSIDGLVGIVDKVFELLAILHPSATCYWPPHAFPVEGSEPLLKGENDDVRP